MGNSLKIDLERYNGLEIQLQVERQKVEEMNSVIKMKNDQLRQVLDEYDNIQHQLEIEVEAHTSCQQELEKIQWDKENFLMENGKSWRIRRNLASFWMLSGKTKLWHIASIVNQKTH